MPGCARLCLVWLLVAVGCAQADLERQVIPCTTDRECPADHARCVGAPAPDRPALANCTDTCFADTECPLGSHCDPVGRFSCQTCVENCTPAACADDEVCRDDGRCVLTHCTEPDAPACPAGWHCDPSAPSSENEGAKAGLVDARTAERGCARTRCDDGDGIECADLWRCDPTQTDFSTGCVPLPCSDTGRCSNDATFTCEPNNDAPRTSGMDPQGCVYKNCGEGVPCPSAQICEQGVCRQRTCAELSCSANSHCEQVTPDYAACYTDASSGAGTGGSLGGGSGTSATGGSATGGASSGGDSSGTGGTGLALTGHCE